MLRVGLIGAGNIAQTHLRAIAGTADVRLTAVCDVVEQRAREAAQNYGGKPYTDYRTMLEQEDLQALFICVPPDAHSTMEEEAAARGVHLLVEKPVTLTLEEARRKQAAIEQAGIIAAAGYCLRYSPLVDKVREWLGQGFQTVLAEARYWGGTPEAPWWPDYAKSGGQLVEQTTHVVDLLRFLVGEVAEVQAQYTRAAAPDDPAFTVPTAGSVSLRFTGGAVGTISTSCVVGAFEAGVNLLGPDGAIRYTYGEASLIRGRNTVTEKPTGDMYAIQDRAFLKAVATGDTSLLRCTYADAVKTLALTLAANQSAAEGHPVNL